VDFRDKLYETTEDKASTASWKDVKDDIGMSFPNLPYFVDVDGYKLSET